MCEFKLRVYLNSDGELKLIHGGVVNVKVDGSKVLIFSDDGSKLTVNGAVILEVDAERQLVILSKLT